MKLPVAILAGGMATRLHPLTLEVPKSLIPINNYPFIGWQLKLLANSGIESVILCLGNMAQSIIDFVGNGEQFELDVQYSVEDSQLGTGGALKKALPLLGESFGVLYGDSYLNIDYLGIQEFYFAAKHDALMTIYKNMDSLDKSNVAISSTGSFKYSKKNSFPDKHFIDYGFSLFRRSAILDFNADEAFDLSDLFESLSNEDRLGYYEVKNRFYEVGSFGGINELESYLKEEN